MYKKISVMLAMSVLTGCAGMNSDFEHTIPAKDSGYWLQQADDMTNPNMTNKSGSPVGGMMGALMSSSTVLLIRTVFAYQ